MNDLFRRHCKSCRHWTGHNLFPDHAECSASAPPWHLTQPEDVCGDWDLNEDEWQIRSNRGMDSFMGMLDEGSEAINELRKLKEEIDNATT